jgi:hypothetical protein
MKKIILFLCMAVMVMFAVDSFAAPTVCDTTTYTKGAGPYTQLKTAAAANFHQSAIDMAQNFVADNNTPNNIEVIICANSTEILESEITSNSYDVLFAADGSASTYSVYDKAPNYDADYLAFSYARGIPVIFALKTASGSMSTPAGLISGLTPAEVASSSTSKGTGSWTGYSIASGLLNAASSVTVADDGAPYGRAAHDILNDMMGTSLPGTLPTTPTSWVSSHLWSNIALTKQAVLTSPTVNDGGTDYPTSSIQAGFVGKSQLCDTGLSNYVYVGFVSTDYTLNQTMGLTSTNAVGQDLYRYIKARISDTSWATFLTNHCYYVP